jgi:hypothetical protein
VFFFVNKRVFWASSFRQGVLRREMKGVGKRGRQIACRQAEQTPSVTTGVCNSDRATTNVCDRLRARLN